MLLTLCLHRWLPFLLLASAVAAATSQSPRSLQLEGHIRRSLAQIVEEPDDDLGYETAAFADQLEEEEKGHHSGAAQLAASVADDSYDEDEDLDNGPQLLSDEKVFGGDEEVDEEEEDEDPTQPKLTDYLLDDTDAAAEEVESMDVAEANAAAPLISGREGASDGLQGSSSSSFRDEAEDSSFSSREDDPFDTTGPDIVSDVDVVRPSRYNNLQLALQNQLNILEPEPLGMSEETKQSIQAGLAAHDTGEPLPVPKNTTTKKVTPLTEKGSDATADEKQTQESLEDMTDVVAQDALDDRLAAEKAAEAARVAEAEDEVTDDVVESFRLPEQEAAQPSVSASMQEDFERDEESVVQLEPKLTPSFDEDALRSPGDSGHTEESSPSNSSLLTTGVILGGTIKNMVADNSSSVARIVAVVLAIVAGSLVAVAGIALFRRFRRGREGKPVPRIIEIGSLGHKTKSPTYSRVGNKNEDGEGSSGTRWLDGWEDQPPRTTSLNSGGVKQKKAWDWDAEW